MAKKGSRSLFFSFLLKWSYIFFQNLAHEGKMCPWKGKMRPWKGTSTMWKLGIWHLLLRFWCSAFALWGYSQIRSLFHPSTCRRGEPFSLLLKFKKIRSCWFLVANLGYSPFSPIFSQLYYKMPAPLPVKPGFSLSLSYAQQIHMHSVSFINIRQWYVVDGSIQY